MEFNTLQDFLLTTEIYSYLTAIASVIAFGLFWRVLNKKPNRKKNKPSDREIKTEINIHRSYQ